jgi:hypothetical protein
VRGDAAAFFQPASLKRRFVLMFLPAILPPNSLCLAALTRSIIALLGQTVEKIERGDHQES